MNREIASLAKPNLSHLLICRILVLTVRLVINSPSYISSGVVYLQEKTNPPPIPHDQSGIIIITCRNYISPQCVEVDIIATLFLEMIHVAVIKLSHCYSYYISCQMMKKSRKVKRGCDVMKYSLIWLHQRWLIIVNLLSINNLSPLILPLSNNLIK